ncbi:MAG: hypothetical protein O3B21_09880 [Proteobacteria bacterium]|nr:hypothetical protein [Pseudomonadota bacterium]MDA1356895.1 hypothetical protein [Pseudomonadota bacterium]
MLQTIDHLREIKQRCMAGEPLETQQSEWLASALEHFLDRRCTSMDDALGLRFAQGGMPWWREEANRVRDAALREIADTYENGLSKSAQAKQIALLALRYGASAWRFDRISDDMPAHYEDTVKEQLWQAFQSGATMPIGERQLRNILVG